MAPSSLIGFLGLSRPKRNGRSDSKSQSGSPPPPYRPNTRPATAGASASAPPLPSRPPAPPQQQPQWHAGIPYPPHGFHPAGYLPGPQGWGTYPYDQVPIVVNQHYYVSALPPSSRPPGSCVGSSTIGKLNLGSMVNLANEVLPQSLQMAPPPRYDDCLPAWHGYGSQLLNQSAAICDQLSTRLNDVLTLIDRERYKGNERELFTIHPNAPISGVAAASQNTSIVTSTKPSNRSKPRSSSRSSSRRGKTSSDKDHPKGQTTSVAASVISGDYFAKVELYSNSKLPMNLPPLRLYIPTWPLLCLAAQYSERVYEKPRGAERDTHVDADWRTGAKAMVVKSVPMDHMNTIVFAIRGTATFMDWAVNLNAAPTSPAGFLEDPGNFCHAGFLSVARKMVVPVAARLRRLLEEDPSRSSYSLLLTGHSAGGAVAALLYSHLMGAGRNGTSSELTLLAGCFRRIHCVTFGAPPVTLLPLTAPPSDATADGGSTTTGGGSGSGRKSIFLSFVNEGDPVVRADKAYVKSLLELFAAPAPSPTSPGQSAGKPLKETSGNSRTKPGKKAPSVASSSHSKKSSSADKARPGPVWPVPPSTLSNAGRVVVLRSGDPKARLRGRKTVEERLDDGVVAQVVTDEQLRTVVWGDPVAHLMRLYAGRIETLAVGAVTAKGY